MGIDCPGAFLTSADATTVAIKILTRPLFLHDLRFDPGLICDLPRYGSESTVRGMQHLHPRLAR